MNFTHHNFISKAILVVKIKASYLILLFVHEKANLNEYGIGIPYGVIKTTLAPPLYSYLDPSK